MLKFEYLFLATLFSGYCGRYSWAYNLVRRTYCEDVDNVSIRPPGASQYMGCRDLVYYYPDYCTRRYVDNGVSDVCCDSCRYVDTSCVDDSLLMVAPPGTATYLKCRDLAAQYPFYCKHNIRSSYKNRCCASCRYADTRCTDNPEFSYCPPDYCPSRHYLRCRDLVRVYPYFCSLQAYKDNCCESCRGVDPCQDQPGYVYQVNRLPLTCAQLANYYPEYCPQVAHRCCRSC